MPHKIMIYKDAVSAPGLLIHSLKGSFDPAYYKTKNIDITDIRNSALRRNRKKSLLVLPGIYGEDSRYHIDFKKDELDEYHAFIERGNVSLVICAGANALSRKCNYVTPWGTIKKIQSLRPIFNGVSHGPIWPYATEPLLASIESTLPQIANTSLIPVQFKTEDGTWDEAHITYGNGPAMYPDDVSDPRLEILATYSFNNQNPAALVRVEIGKGSVYLCSMHPEIFPIEINPKGNPHLVRIRALNEALKPHEPGRQKLWTMLTNRIKKDLSP